MHTSQILFNYRVLPCPYHIWPASRIISLYLIVHTSFPKHDYTISLLYSDHILHFHLHFSFSG